MTLFKKTFRPLSSGFAAAWLIFAPSGCSDSKTSVVKLDGNRFSVTLTRSVDVNEWVAVAGSQEWWFFAAGVFRQVSSAYIEPQFYGATVACGGDATGTWSYVKDGEEDGMTKVSLTYDGVRNVSGVCRMSSREISVVTQPSGVVDLLDAGVVQRLTKVQALQ